ncbi:MAG: hypothetical protein R6X16_08735 [Anaerolineae bacterium]
MPTLADLVTAVAADLQDAAYTQWSVDDHEANIRRALANYSTLNPRRASAVLDTVAGGREIDISSLAALEVVDLWYPWDPAAQAYPPPRPPFTLLDAGTLYLETDSAPLGAASDRLRLFYLTAHTIEDLDGATATTLDDAGVALVTLLATASAAMQRCQSTIGRVTVSNWTPGQLLDWARARQAQADAACEALRRRLAAAGEARVHWDGV